MLRIASVCRPRAYFTSLFLTLYSLKRSYYNRSIVSKPYLIYMEERLHGLQSTNCLELCVCELREPRPHFRVTIITSDTPKCRSFLALLGARMRNLRPCDNGKFPFSSLWSARTVSTHLYSVYEW